jgi:hypothetical protein
MSDLKMENFSEKKRKEYLKETTQSLNALLDDAFLGDDQNELRAEFPPDCKRNDIKIENTKVSLAFINDAIEPQIEIIIQIGYKDAIIGEYGSVYIVNGELLDEFFFME